MRIPVDSDWAGSEERYSGGHLVVSWVASDKVRALSSGEAELHRIADGYVRKDETNHLHRCRDGLDGCNLDLLPNERWKNKAHPSSMVSGSKTPFVTMSCV